MKYAFISAQRHQYPVRRLCEVLSVSPSGYYSWVDRPPSRRTQEDQRLLQAIRRVHHQSRQRYGIRRTWQALRRSGDGGGRNRIARLRKAHGIEARQTKRQRGSRQARQLEAAADNVLDRQFKPVCHDAVWCADITFIATRSGWLYLAVVLDLYARVVVGWSMGERINENLVIDALKLALARRHPKPGLVHHSDQGTQYRGRRYQALLTDNQMTVSMSRKGNPHDNAVVESFFSSLKKELIHGCSFDSRDQARSAIFEYIEIFYNRQRLHSTLGYLAPMEYESLRNVA